jgi:hypothetical protein
LASSGIGGTVEGGGGGEQFFVQIVGGGGEQFFVQTVGGGGSAGGFTCAKSTCSPKLTSNATIARRYHAPRHLGFECDIEFFSCFLDSRRAWCVGFTGGACSEPKLLQLAYAFEQATKKRTPPPGLR